MQKILQNISDFQNALNISLVICAIFIIFLFWAVIFKKSYRVWATSFLVWSIFSSLLFYGGLLLYKNAYVEEVKREEQEKVLQVKREEELKVLQERCKKEFGEGSEWRSNLKFCVNPKGEARYLKQ